MEDQPLSELGRSLVLPSCPVTHPMEVFIEASSEALCRRTAPYRLNRANNQEYPDRGKPDPLDLTGEDTHSIRAEKLSDTDRRHRNRPNSEEISVGVERGEERILRWSWRPARHGKRCRERHRQKDTPLSMPICSGRTDLRERRLADRRRKWSVSCLDAPRDRRTECQRRSLRHPHPEQSSRLRPAAQQAES